MKSILRLLIVWTGLVLSLCVCSGHCQELSRDTNVRGRNTGRGSSNTVGTRILLDACLGEAKVSDSAIGRHPNGSFNFGQYEVAVILEKQAYIVENNEDERSGLITYEKLRPYDLVICNNTNLGDREIAKKALDAFVEYVRNGGNLLVICSANSEQLGIAQFYNPLVNRFGISFDESVQTKPCTLQCNEVANHPAVQNIRSFYVCGWVPTRVRNGAVLAWYDGYPIMVLTRFGRGMVMAAGIGRAFQGTCMNANFHPSRAKYAQQNSALLISIVNYLATVSRR